MQHGNSESYFSDTGAAELRLSSAIASIIRYDDDDDDDDDWFVTKPANLIKN